MTKSDVDFGWVANLSFSITVACALNLAHNQAKYGPDIGKRLAFGGTL